MTTLISDEQIGSLERWLTKSKVYAAEGDTVLRIITRLRSAEDCLTALYTFPGVRDLLAPQESLGSIAAQIDSHFAKVAGEKG